jgi:hypothetical protein
MLRTRRSLKSTRADSDSTRVDRLCISMLTRAISVTSRCRMS